MVEKWLGLWLLQVKRRGRRREEGMDGVKEGRDGVRRGGIEWGGEGWSEGVRREGLDKVRRCNTINPEECSRDSRNQCTD
jgi:hypothetical protein